MKAQSLLSGGEELTHLIQPGASARGSPVSPGSTGPYGQPSSVRLLHYSLDVVAICGPLRELIPPGLTDVEAELLRTFSSDVVIVGQR